MDIASENQTQDESINLVGTNSTSWTTQVLVLIIFALVTKLVWNLLNGRKLPPGPWGLPFLGYGPFLTRTPYVKFCEIAQSYGPVFQLTLLGRTVIVLNGYDAIEEALIKQGPNFAGRPTEFSLGGYLFDNRDILFSEKEHWKIHRGFFFKSLRTIGYGTSRFNKHFQQITSVLLDEMRNSDGNPINLQKSFTFLAANGISAAMFSKVYERNDPKINRFIELLHILVKTIPGYDAFVAGTISRLMANPLNPTWNKMVALKTEMHQILGEIVDEARVNMTGPNEEPRDYVDAFLRNQSDPAFTDIDLRCNLLQAMLAGMETVSSTLYFAVKYMAMYPQVQKRCQEEIRRVIGDREPSINDHLNTPYVDAVIAEVQRYSSIAPLTPIHCNHEETTLYGYTIPARSYVLVNYWSAVHDPKYFATPEEFNPQHFLDAEGKFVKINASIPYGTGKRICAGEMIARVELFVVFCKLLQQFDFAPPEGEVLNDCIDFACCRMPTPYKLRSLVRVQ
eukprot:TRINITY_DN4001_c0_g1_i1.p1 TRINITY_DN4001_c0_g1~~TRINITY_DN4001_c0_g1_i1.p1  ORF type:complete len:508 (-),score=86.24 TRINITY_DN4001_c0_g1_i1:68-1591(-)